MSNPFTRLTGPDGFYVIINLLVGLCVVLLFTAVLMSFRNHQKNRAVQREKRSVVDTATMIIFFLIFYGLIRMGIGTLPHPAEPWGKLLALAGLALVVLGLAVNVRGRMDLGNNWGNQIRIYTEHTLVQQGTYRLVRHPLYASIIWMFGGACLIYLNWAALLALLVIFIPFMILRSRQEEKLLGERFGQYHDYRRRTGMFFPKLIVRRQR